MPHTIGFPVFDTPVAPELEQNDPGCTVPADGAGAGGTGAGAGAGAGATGGSGATGGGGGGGATGAGGGGADAGSGATAFSIGAWTRGWWSSTSLAGVSGAALVVGVALVVGEMLVDAGTDVVVVTLVLSAGGSSAVVPHELSIVDKITPPMTAPATHGSFFGLDGSELGGRGWA